MEKDTATLHINKSIRCIVKLGGAAITCKNELEKINEENLKIVSSQLRQSMINGSSSEKVLGMDWSKKSGNLEISCNADDFKEQPIFDSCNFVVVHGAGSFGHFQASKSGVHKGGLNLPIVKSGFVATRISVTTLNLEIVRPLAKGNTREYLQLECHRFLVDGQPQEEMLEFSRRSLEQANLSAVAKAINLGFVPVLHGVDDLQGCTILSGDVIIRYLAANLKPEYVVFLTDVLGVYDRPPSESDAVLLREIAVSEDGSWSVVRPTLGDANKRVEMTVAAHDTTGGMETKITEAAMIAKLGTDVYIVKAGTSHSLRALNGELVDGNIPDDWLGTVIRFAGKRREANE